MQHADALFGVYDIRLSKMSDVAGVLRYRERKVVRHLLDGFERRFPQLFFSAYYGAEEDSPCIRQFGVWLLNRGVFEDVKNERRNEAGIILTINVATKSAGISYGYFLEPYLNEQVTFDALSRAHPYLLQSDYQQATEIIVDYIEKVLIKESKKVKRNRKAYENRISGPPKDTVEEVADEPERESPSEKEPVEAPASTKEEADSYVSYLESMTAEQALAKESSS